MHPPFKIVRRDRIWVWSRLLLSSWRRFRRWEFWPPSIIYIPVLIRIAGLMLKHRSATVFTAANPAIPAGGFIGESKFEILRGLEGSREFVARSLLISGGTSSERKLEQCEQFMKRAGLDLPIVLKPNEGQRGSGVVVARTREALAAYLEQSRIDTIVQEYVPGLELGVFYCRRPSEPTGRIFSITRKFLPVVIGDGRSTLERLILLDSRAIGMARFHLRRQRERLAGIPLEGEAVSLGDCGSHCRGALFVDGGSLRTPALERAFDEVARRFEGFFFGRFDVKVESLADFREGKGFTIIELNGVTSEATHIYDPSIGLLQAYGVLFEQWRLAFEIGEANAGRGVPVWSLRRLIQLITAYRRTAKAHLEPQSNAGDLSTLQSLSVPSR